MQFILTHQISRNYTFVTSQIWNQTQIFYQSSQFKKFTKSSSSRYLHLQKNRSCSMRNWSWNRPLKLKRDCLSSQGKPVFEVGVQIQRQQRRRRRQKNLVCVLGGLWRRLLDLFSCSTIFSGDFFCGVIQSTDLNQVVDFLLLSLLRKKVGHWTWIFPKQILKLPKPVK